MPIKGNYHHTGKLLSEHEYNSQFNFADFQKMVKDKGGYSRNELSFPTPCGFSMDIEASSTQ